MLPIHRAIVIGLVLLISACGGSKGHKVSLKKDGKGKGAESDWFKTTDNELVAKDQSGKVQCFNLAAALTKIAATPGLLTIHTFDLDLGSVVTDEKSKFDRFEPADESFDLSRAHYFFGDEHLRVTDLAEVIPAKDIAKSKLVGDLLALSKQTACSEFMFRIGPDARSFAPQSKWSRRGIQLIDSRGGEVRSYFLKGKNQFVVTVMDKVGRLIPSCGDKPQTRLAVKKAYIISRTTEGSKALPMSTVSIAPGLGRLFKKYIYDATDLNAAAPTPGKNDKVKTAPRSEMSLAAFEYTWGLFRSKTYLQDLSCKSPGK
ncbi:MAG: hypothetical protein AB7F86_04750 [Bdellovibrionales bacterium]